MYSLSGGRRLAHQRASSDPTPMNHSNKDGTSPAESGEGRPLIKENALPLTRTRLRAGLRVSHGWASVRTSDRWAAIHPR